MNNIKVILIKKSNYCVYRGVLELENETILSPYITNDYDSALTDAKMLFYAHENTEDHISYNGDW